MTAEQAGLKPYRGLTSRPVVLPQDDIDTDQILPARFLTTTSREGLGRALFYDWRYDANGDPRPDSPLNGVDQVEHEILVAGQNFGCGSSREHAAWALLDFGFRAIVSTEIADTFRSNALNNGLLPIDVDRETLAFLMANKERPVTIDLRSCELRMGTQVVWFVIEEFARQCLLQGLDPLGWLLARLPEIEAFEAEQDQAGRN